MNTATTMDMPTGEQGSRVWEIVFGSSVVVGMLKLAEKLLPLLIAKKRSWDVVRGLEDLRKMYDSMEAALDHGAHRVMFLSAHNSGGLPKPGQPFYSSAVHWVAVREYRAKVENYREIELDAPYITMLNHLAQQGSYHFKMSENKDSLLHGFYEAEGVTDSILVYIGIVGVKMLYMSFARYSGEFTNNEVTALKLRANEVRNLIKLQK
jgi:hypothetical protein